MVYLLKIKTEAGVRYLGNPSCGVRWTLHPAKARLIDFDRRERWTADVIEAVDTGPVEFVRWDYSECMKEGCLCRTENPPQE